MATMLLYNLPTEAWSPLGKSSLDGAALPWSIVFLKSETSMQGAGLSVSLRKCKNILRSLCQVSPSLPPPAAASPCCGWPAHRGRVGKGDVFFPLCLYTAVFGLATEFYHTRVHVVIQSGKNFPECLEKPETLNGFQGLLMWLAQEIAVRQ